MTTVPTADHGSGTASSAVGISAFLADHSYSCNLQSYLPPLPAPSPAPLPASPVAHLSSSHPASSAAARASLPALPPPGTARGCLPSRPGRRPGTGCGGWWRLSGGLRLPADHRPRPPVTAAHRSSPQLGLDHHSSARLNPITAGHHSSPLGALTSRGSPNGTAGSLDRAETEKEGGMVNRSGYIGWRR